MGTLLSVNVGRPAVVGTWRGHPAHSAIGKVPVPGRIRVEGVNLAGDDQADRRVHGGPDKAIYAYASEDSAWWEDILARKVPPGMFGENLTTEGINCSGAIIGERWRVGTTLLEVCQPRLPCYKLGLRFRDPTMLKRFAMASRPGAYLRIIEEGDIGQGDQIEVVSRPDHAVTIAMVSDAILLDEDLLPEMLAADQLPDELRAWIAERAAV